MPGNPSKARRPARSSSDNNGSEPGSMRIVRLLFELAPVSE